MDFSLDHPGMHLIASRVHSLSKDLHRYQSGIGPSREEIEAAPVLSNWSLGQRLEPALLGVAVDHPLLGTRSVLTSPLYILDREAGWARTFSRLYRLGAEA